MCSKLWFPFYVFELVIEIWFLNVSVFNNGLENDRHVFYYLACDSLLSLPDKSEIRSCSLTNFLFLGQNSFIRWISGHLIKFYMHNNKVRSQKTKMKKKSKEETPHFVLFHQVLKHKLLTKRYAIFHSNIIELVVLKLTLRLHFSSLLLP